MNRSISEEAKAEQRQLRNEEQRAATQARMQGRNVTFIASDGCEVTVNPQGQTFYNMADWW